MKAITLYQPHASLVAIGAKKIETRSWGTSYRGPLAIHAARSWPGRAKQLCLTEPFRSILRAAGYIDISCAWKNNFGLPFGEVIAITWLAGIEKIYPPLRSKISFQEWSFGDYSEGRWAWILGDIKRIDPVPARGARKLWEWKDGDNE